MNSKFEERLRYWLREASDQGDCGFVYDHDLPEEEQEDWMYCEDSGEPLKDAEWKNT